MGFFDFVKDTGKKLFGGNDEEAIKKEIEENNETMPFANLEVIKEGDVVTLKGEANNAEDVTKAALISGNVEGVSKVVFDDVKLKDETPIEEKLYEIQAGDNLSKIAKEFYGDANKYRAIFDANLEVIKDPDKIYIGQKIRIPTLLA